MNHLYSPCQKIILTNLHLDGIETTRCPPAELGGSGISGSIDIGLHTEEALFENETKECREWKDFEVKTNDHCTNLVFPVACCANGDIVVVDVLSFTRCLERDSFDGALSRSIECGPLWADNRLNFCGCAELTVPNDEFDWAAGSFRGLPFVTKNGGGGGMVANAGFDDMGRWATFTLGFLLWNISVGSFGRSPKNETLLTNEDSHRSSCWVDEDLSDGFGGNAADDFVGERLGSAGDDGKLIIVLLSVRIRTDRFADLGWKYICCCWSWSVYW